MPTIVFPDGGHVGGGLTCFDNGYNLIGLGTLEVALHKVIAPAWGIFLNGYTPFLGAVLDPIKKIPQDRKSTRLNSSHANISYAVFCLKKKKKKQNDESNRNSPRK